MEPVDLGISEAEWFDQGAQRSALILPGAYYLPMASLLWYTS